MIRLGHSGFSVIEALISLVIVAILIVAAMELFGAQLIVTKDLKAKIAASAQETILKEVFSDVEICSCQLNASTNTAYASALQVNTTAPDSASISLPVLRTSCDLTSTTNYVARVGHALSASAPGVLVTNIEINRLHATGGRAGEYRGFLTASLRVTGSTKQLYPIEIPLRFQIDLSSGSAASRPILGCSSKDIDVIPNCPTGFVRVGSSYGSGFCILSTSNPPQAWYAAQQTCHGIVRAGWHRPTVCSISQQIAACREGLFGSDTRDHHSNAIFPDQSFLPESDRSVSDVFQPVGCLNNDDRSVSDAYPFRCCL